MEQTARRVVEMFIEEGTLPEKTSRLIDLALMSLHHGERITLSQWKVLRDRAYELIPACRRSPRFSRHRTRYLYVVTAGLTELERMLKEEPCNEYACKDWLTELEVEFAPSSTIYTHLCKPGDTCFTEETWGMLCVLRKIAVSLKAQVTLARIERDMNPHRKERVQRAGFVDARQNFR